MKYPKCPDCGCDSARLWNGVICRKCGHDVSAYDKSVLPGSDGEADNDDGYVPSQGVVHHTDKNQVQEDN